jgi:hypothetical protein
VQYVLILLRALFGETDVRNSWTHEEWGVVSEHPMEAIWGRRQCRR